MTSFFSSQSLGYPPETHRHPGRCVSVPADLDAGLPGFLEIEFVEVETVVIGVQLEGRSGFGRLLEDSVQEPRRSPPPDIRRPDGWAMTRTGILHGAQPFSDVCLEAGVDGRDDKIRSWSIVREISVPSWRMSTSVPFGSGNPRILVDGNLPMPFSRSAKVAGVFD